MMRRTITALFFVACAGCDRAPEYNVAAHSETAVETAEKALVGPGGRNITSDPCPDSPDSDASCGYLVSARRISWFGYLARWMRLTNYFGVQPQNPGAYADMESEALSLGFGHPDRFLGPLVEPLTPRSQYYALHEVLGEPLDDLGAEDTPIVVFRQQHKIQFTAAVVKQACRVSAALASRVASRMRAGGYDANQTALIGNLIEADINGGAITTIRAFKPAFGYVVWGRKLEQRELDPINAALGANGARAADNYAGFRTALTALMCSTMSLVE